MKILIVGSSFSSAVISKELSKLNVKIDIIDVNSFYDENKYLLIKKEKILNLKKNFFQYHGWGGGSNLWHGVITKFDKLEINKYKKIGLNLNFIYKKFQKKALLFLGIKSNFTHKKNLIKNTIIQKCLKSNYLNKKNFLIQKKPFNTIKIFEKLKNKKKINIIENICAVSINHSFSKVNYLNVYDTKLKKKKKLYADIFILSLGAIETPRLLLQSKRNNKNFFNNNLIGIGLNDHYKGTIGKFISKESINFDFKLNNSENFRIGFTPKINKYGNFCIVFRNSYEKNYVKIISVIKKFLKKKNYKKICNLLFNLQSKYLIIFLKSFILKIKPILFVTAELWLETIQSKYNRIKLTNNKDKFGRYVPKIEFTLGNKEKYQINNSQNILKDIFNSGETIFRPVKFSIKNFSSGAHFTNSCRIGKNSINSVVNKNLKVHNFKNLYICDNSILNYTGNSNPTFTLIIYAFRLSDFIKKLLSKKNLY